MLSYDDLVSGLEDAWLAVGLHEHAFIESVIPTTHDRTCKIELFPEHDEPLTNENIPPWLELGFTWSAVHQLIAEGRDLPSEPLDLTWSYTVTLANALDRSDAELVRMFQRAVHGAFVRYYPAEATEMEPVAVEVRRIYQSDGQKLTVDSIQMVSTTISDLFEQWGDRDLAGLRMLLRIELQLASAIIANLSDAFTPRGRGGYRSVDAA
ncbi:hypothetical protein K2Z83_23305 [Oscillochloris sp. ZM17-4]|uniref:hypothetical protein n=1 Tax=Oscillochloris sp. ZM17-4 TaxID=2866714 RepID=UPI001C73ACA0|nr:hypothetical protein [Oscillochloris sp. ZM17-4]MBX0330589.1 hypothetical protein [Oscillochloris sp. ZM17-4]